MLEPTVFQQTRLVPFARLRRRWSAHRPTVQEQNLAPPNRETGQRLYSGVVGFWNRIQEKRQKGAQTAAHQPANPQENETVANEARGQEVMEEDSPAEFHEAEEEDRSKRWVWRGGRR